MSIAKKEIQLLELEILKEVIRISDENNLTYYIIGGSLIGVLRHKGFIPWDDDIDIGMPRSDYEKFIEICKKDINGQYAIIDNSTDPKWFFNFAQIVNKKIKIKIETTENPRISNPWVDLFPIDGLPSDKKKRKRHFRKILHYRYLIQLANIENQVDQSRKDRPLRERLILKIFSTFKIKKFINSKNILRKMKIALKTYDFYQSEYAGNLLGRYREKEVVPKNYFGKPKKLPFEEIMVNVPEKYHELQTHLYGDYMSLPPKEKQVTHSITIISNETNL